jgi:hypothetical protein
MLGLPGLGGSGDRTYRRCQREPQPDCDDHRRDIAERVDAHILLDNASEEHQYPCAHKERWPSRRQFHKIAHGQPFIFMVGTAAQAE